MNIAITSCIHMCSFVRRDPGPGGASGRSYADCSLSQHRLWRGSTLLRRAQREALRWLIDRYATDIVACGEGIMSANWRPDWHRESRCRVLYSGSTPEG